MQCTSSGIPAYAFALHHVLTHVNAKKPPKLPRKTIETFQRLFADDETYIDMELTPVHRIVLGLLSVDLDLHLECSVRDIDAPDASSKTPLMYAAARGDTEKMRVLLRWGAKMDCVDRVRRTALNYAVSDGTDECVLILLKAGANPNGDGDSLPPITDVYLTPYERTASIQALVAHGADPNGLAWSSNALHWLWGCHGPGVGANTAALLEHGTDPDMLDEDGMSAVANAAVSNNIPLLEVLLSHGGRVENGTDIRGILSMAAQMCSINTWALLARSARRGRLRDVDCDRLHKGHQVWICLQACRDRSLGEKRGPLALEQPVFEELYHCIRQSQIDVEEMQDPEEMLSDKLAQTVLDTKWTEEELKIKIVEPVSSS